MLESDGEGETEFGITHQENPGILAIINPKAGDSLQCDKH